MAVEPPWVLWLAGAAAAALFVYLTTALWRAEDMT